MSTTDLRLGALIKLWFFSWVVLLLLGEVAARPHSKEVGAAVGQIRHPPQHPPESPEPGEGWLVRVFWLLVGIILLLACHEAYLGIKTFLRRSACPLEGAWVSVDPPFVSLVVPRYTADAWHLTVADQAYALTILKYDWEAGTAQGNITCARAKYVVGTWTIAPSNDRTNRFALCLKMGDKSVTTVLRQAE